MVKWLQKIFARGRRHFEAGGRLRALACVFDAAEAIFFLPLNRSRTAPHVRDALDVKRYMAVVIAALIPATLAGIYLFGPRVLAMIAVSYAAGGAAEVAFAVIRREEINEGFLVTGLLFPLVLPPALPLWMVAAGVVFGVVIGKELFGGTGRNLFNPALVGRCFLAVAYPEAMSGGYWLAPASGWGGAAGRHISSAAEAVTQATPLVEARSGRLAPAWDMLWGDISGSVGETSAVLLILGGLALIAARVVNWRTVVGTLVGFVASASAMHAAAPAGYPPAWWGMLGGGFMLGAFYMATDPVTSPATNQAKWAYGLIIGLCTVLIRNLSAYPEGVMFAILLGNICAPILDEIVLQFEIRRLRREA